MITLSLTTLSTIGLSPCLSRQSHTGILSLYVGLLILIALFWIVLSLFVSGTIQRILRGPSKLSIEKHRTWFRGVVLLCLLFLFFVGQFINQNFLPHKLHLASWLGNAILLAFASFLGWCLFKPTVRKTLVLFLAAFAFGIFLLAVTVLQPVDELPRSTPLEQLETLGYVNWRPASGTMTGVTKHIPEESYPGLNLYCSKNLSAAFLIDMDGEIVHEWSVDLLENDTWVHVELCKNGDLIGYVRDRVYFRIDWDSNVKWTQDLCAHHDIAVHESDDIFVLTANTEVALINSVPAPIYNNTIAVLTPDGDLKKQVSLNRVLREHYGKRTAADILRWFIVPANLREMLASQGRLGPPDLLHVNTIEIIPRDAAGSFKNGNILFCSRSLDLVGVIDMDQERLVWTWGPGELEEPHHPTLLENGNVLVFDNGTRRKSSRILEVNPRTGEIEWQYESDPPERFYSHRGGANQRLPNGNTLITDADNGHVFEITRDGKIVWEFYNPELSEDRNERAVIYRMMRITDLARYDHLPPLFKQ